MWLCVLATGIASVTLRILAHQSEVREHHYHSTLYQPLIDVPAARVAGALVSAGSFVRHKGSPTYVTNLSGGENQPHSCQQGVCDCRASQPAIVSTRRTMVITRLTSSSSVFPFWAWAGFSDQPIVVLVFQHIQILIDTHDPSLWPRPKWRQQKHPEANILELADQPTRQEASCERSGKSDSKRDLLSTHSNEAGSEAAFEY